ncbi:hypothetical protein F5J12DRAFT_461928 [Pisolithus orientalis]|uniref:uncharacterized protein n=1 Tax=Pisolithus orientalis TaxID=936130 RepID=UPI002224FB57|nr:uncharacterized protein F5J12DRAFT_461928 [Pisolithus orientalis]KAI5992016.1 hypothetical protein F5J12DRAFT_461928 [Pisolithus orientalis]
MSWAADRKTTRVEDRAYSLMGLFGVNMPMLYGEGEKAFQRLQLEIIRTSSNHSIFAWNPHRPRAGSVLAGSKRLSGLWCHGEGGARRICRRTNEGDRKGRTRQSLALSGYLDQPDTLGQSCMAEVACPSLSQSLRTFAVSNAGIQVCLPVIPYHKTPSHLRALLACRIDGFGLAIIDLVFSGSSFDRTNTTDIPTAFPGSKTLYLTHNHIGTNWTDGVQG